MRPTVCPSGVPSLRRFPASKETKTRFAQASVLGLPAENLLRLAALTWGEGHKTPLFLCYLFSPPLRLSGTSSRSGSLNSCAMCRPNNRPTPKHRSRNDNNRLPILEANQGATSPKTYNIRDTGRIKPLRIHFARCTNQVSGLRFTTATSALKSEPGYFFLTHPTRLITDLLSTTTKITRPIESD